jgi:uncharacterized protein YjaZ
MELIAIDALAAQRAALEAPAADRMTIFREQVMVPLIPFWEPFLSWGPQAAADDGVEPYLKGARRFGFYSPEQDIAAGLRALDRFAEAGTWAECVAAVERAWATLAPEQHGIDLPQLRYTLLLGDPAKLDPKMGGYTGVGGWPGRVLAIAWPNDFNLPRLAAVTAHEVHHNVRFSYEPFIPHTVTVGQYIVAEGLAEAFAAELYGEDKLGPWVSVLDDAQAAAIMPRFREAVERQGFDITRAYIFGDWAAESSGYTAQGIPDFAGYCIGYRTVRAFLAKRGLRAAEATYLPWREIVDGSGLF